MTSAPGDWHMEQLILDFLGPVAGVPMALAALRVWWKRRVIRRGHVVALVGLTAVGLAGFTVAFWVLWFGQADRRGTRC